MEIKVKTSSEPFYVDYSDEIDYNETYEDKEISDELAILLLASYKAKDVPSEQRKAFIDGFIQGVNLLYTFDNIGELLEDYKEEIEERFLLKGE